jgi:hypothetical protein
MKKVLILLPLLLIMFGCEEESSDPSPADALLGTWTVTNLGEFANSDCSGAVDYTAWAFIQTFGVSMEFEFKSNGTIDWTTTAFGVPETESLTYTVTDDELCIEGDCFTYTLNSAGNNLVFTLPMDAYCEDDDGLEVSMDETACDGAGYEWNPASCSEFTLTK